jgi:hypothetical protein
LGCASGIIIQTPATICFLAPLEYQRQLQDVSLFGSLSKK